MQSLTGIYSHFNENWKRSILFSIHALASGHRGGVDPVHPAAVLWHPELVCPHLPVCSLAIVSRQCCTLSLKAAEKCILTHTMTYG